MPSHSWRPARRYVTEEDLAFFKAHMEQNVPVDGATNWEPIMNRDFGSFTYTAWRRILPVSSRLCLSADLCQHRCII